jgi:hypothetical protein
MTVRPMPLSAEAEPPVAMSGIDLLGWILFAIVDAISTPLPVAESPALGGIRLQDSWQQETRQWISTPWV